jgi:hypothetical protein
LREAHRLSLVVRGAAALMPLEDMSHRRSATVAIGSIWEKRAHQERKCFGGASRDMPQEAAWPNHSGAAGTSSTMLLSARRIRVLTRGSL